MRRRLLTALVALSAAVALASCTDPSPERPDPTDTDVSAEETATDDGSDPEPEADPQFSEADVTHAQQLIELHRTSLELHEIIRSKADIVEDVATLSLSLYTSHYDEVEVLEQMLTEWGEPVPEGDAPTEPGDESEPGDETEDGDEPEDGNDGSGSGAASEVVSEEQIRELGRASGDAANGMYLEQMITLHQARSDIAEDVILEGENADLVDLAQTMLTSQQHEVTHMRDIIEALDLSDSENSENS